MRDPTQMTDRLERFLVEVAGRRGSATNYRLLTGGYSRIIAAADVTWEDGSTQTLVLRGDPPPGEAPFESSRDSEWEFLSALAGTGVAAPAAYWYDATGAHLGTKCIVMEYCPHPTVQTLHAQGTDPRSSVPLIVDTAAAVHAIDPSIMPTSMGRPSDWASYIDGLLAKIRDADATLAESFPNLHYFAAWLAAHRPPEVPLTLVHGDYNASNILLGPDDSHMLLDWEFAHIGDPREDLGYYVNSSRMLGYSSYDPDPRRFLKHYRDRTGLSETQVNEATVEYFALLATLVNIQLPLLAKFAAMARGEAHGSRLMYLIVAVTSSFGLQLDTCKRWAEPLRVLRAQAEATA